VDHGDGITLLPVRGALPSGQCGSCWAERIDADRPSECETSHVDDDVVVIRAPESNGFVVVPRPHVESLEDLPLRCRASVLAAVQRALRSVREENPWSAVRIEVRTDLPTSEGHLSIVVLPGRSGGVGGSSPESA
jgi:diadenosine tetraphosphate (Ap4A) HIT family hydrolase